MDDQNIQQDQYANEKALLESHFATLNPALQNLITNNQTTTTIDSIAKEAGLAEEETDIFSNEVEAALLGFGNPENFAANLIEEGMPADKAVVLAQKADAQIFSQVKNVLKKLYTIEAPSSETQPEVVAPAPTKIPLEDRPIEPFIKATTPPETTHNLDREALLRELESPEPYNVPFTPKKTSFEEKVTQPEPQAPSSEAPGSASHDPYREQPEF